MMDDSALDLLSISQTNQPERCPYGAPLIALRSGERRVIVQSCCNHWDCPICGGMRAKQEYARIVHGAQVLASQHTLYFWTLTCKGRDMPLAEAEENYLKWTNRLLTNARTKARREGAVFEYAQVTERQQRQHPHSHILCTYLPSDAIKTAARKGDGEEFVSRWFSRANVSAGLGTQHQITEVRSAEGAARYVAKYLFKDCQRAKLPKNWRRVRYSQGYPDLPPNEGVEVAYVLRSGADWRMLRLSGERWICADARIFKECGRHVANITI